jgi:hypothetical protein
MVTEKKKKQTKQSQKQRKGCAECKRVVPRRSCTNRSRQRKIQHTHTCGKAGSDRDHRMREQKSETKKETEVVYR